MTNKVVYFSYIFRNNQLNLVFNGANKTKKEVRCHLLNRLE